METLSQVNKMTIKGAVNSRSLIKVCMHVRGTARTDERVMREAVTLKEAGFAVTILDIEDDVTYLVEEEIRGVHVTHIMKPTWLRPVQFRPLRLILSMKKLISTTVKLIQTPADVYHAHDINALPPCYIAAIMRRKKLVFDAHELPLNDLDGKLLLRLRVLMIVLLRIMLSRCSSVITVSLPIAQEMSNRYGVSNVELVRNILVYQAVQKSDRLRQCLNLAPEAHIVLYQGNLQADRGVENLVRAAAFLKQGTVIVLMGKAIGEMQSRLEALIASEGTADRVKVLPPVPYVELLNWTGSADIGLIIYPPDVSLNVQMCLPNKLFEYLMAGLPVLATSLEAVSSLIEAYDVGRVVPSLEPVAIATAINTLLENDADLERMRCNALSATRHDLCWEQEQQQLVRLYRHALKQ